MTAFQENYVLSHVYVAAVYASSGVWAVIALMMALYFIVLAVMFRK